MQTHNRSTSRARPHALPLRQVMYAYAMAPQTLPASYYKFIVRAGPVTEGALQAVRDTVRTGLHLLGGCFVWTSLGASLVGKVCVVYALAILRYFLCAASTSVCHR